MNWIGRQTLFEGWREVSASNEVVANPYLDWWHSIRPEGVDLPPTSGRECRLEPDIGMMDLTLAHNGARHDSGSESHVGAEMTGRALPPTFGDQFPRCEIPVPHRAVNHCFSPQEPWIPAKNDFSIKEWMFGGELPTTFGPDAVIVGVIDRGIPLGHRRLRTADGDSRILSAWMQTTPPRTRDGEIITDDFLPFGRELSKREIDTLLAKHSVGGSLSGTLLEDEFNRACGTLDLKDRLGRRELAGRVAHGAHVLDAAAGFDPYACGSPEQGYPEQSKIWAVTVTLPDRATVGMSGTFLDYYVVYAIYRIAHLADALWDELFLYSDKSGPAGFPIVINISFGKQAGQKNGQDFLDKQIIKLNEQRAKAGRSPLVLVIAAGNENLLRCNAFMSLGAKPEDTQINGQGCDSPPGENGEEQPPAQKSHLNVQTIELQVPPEDHSSNFVEIRSAPIELNSMPENNELPLNIHVNPPGLTVHQPNAIVPGKVFELGKVGRLYVRQDNDGQNCRLFYLICLAPTINQFGGGKDVPIEESPFRTAPAGRWTITLENRSTTPIEAVFSVQTDQSVLPAGATGRRAYFIDKAYEENRFDITSGRPTDSYTYRVDAERTNDRDSGVRRHGTVSATALARKTTFAVAGYRRSDGRPSLFSATKIDRNTLMVTPEFFVAFPAEDDAALFGVLAAGAADGSAVAMQGTSFSAALCTRAIASLLAEDTTHRKAGNYGTSLLERLRTFLAEPREGTLPWPHASEFKTGDGRLDIDLDRRVTRGSTGARLWRRIHATGNVS